MLLPLRWDWQVYILSVWLQLRIRQLERDPYVNPQMVRDLRATAEGLEEAARQFREWESVRRSVSVVANSVEVPRGGSDAGLGNPPNRRVDVGEVAAVLNCSARWVTALCVRRCVRVADSCCMTTGGASFGLGRRSRQLTGRGRRRAGIGASPQPQCVPAPTDGSVRAPLRPFPRERRI